MGLINIQFKIFITTFILMITVMSIANNFKGARDKLFYVFLVLVCSLPIQALAWVWSQ